MTQYCIETDKLTRVFGTKHALNELTLTIPKDGIHAIVGSNGAGKSTLFRILLGLDSQTSGSCHVLGQNSQQLSPDYRGKIGYVNEEHTLPDWMPVENVVALQRSFYPQWRQEIFDRTISYFDIDRKQKIAALSRGERAGVSLSLALAQQPELLILDEPTLGLDVVAKQNFLESLMFIGTEHQASIIYCSHQMDEIERVADNLILMERGRLINNSSPDAFVARVRDWAVDFDGNPVDTRQISGLLSCRCIEGWHQIMVADSDPDIETQLSSLGARKVINQGVNLTTAVNAFLTRNHSKPLEVA